MTAAAGAVARPRASRAAAGGTVGPAQRHTLLITVDRLTPAPEILGVFRRPDEPIVVSAHLHLLCLDRLGLLGQAWSSFTDVLAAGSRRAKIPLPGIDTLAGIDAAELTALPGIDNFLVLRRIRDEAVSGLWRRIVVDLSGAGDPFVVLAAASVLRQALARLWPRHRRLAAAAERPAAAQLTAAVDAIDRDCTDIAELLSDAHTVAAHLVVGADGRAPRLLPEYLATIDLLGVPLRSVHLNEGVSVLSRDTDIDRACGDRVFGDQRALADQGVSVHRIVALDEPIDRPARLRKLQVVLPEPDGRAGGSAAVTVTAPAPAAEQVYELSWPQRLTDPAGLTLGRSGDDLVVTVSGVRHCVQLPSVLRRCDVVDASWDGARIRIRFRPDASVWPRR
ncbi:MAG: ArsA family ATPase [Gordonia sp. (in: high G+C Gram-positive bacteria)]